MLGHDVVINHRSLIRAQHHAEIAGDLPMHDPNPDVTDGSQTPPLAIVMAGGRGARLHELTDRMCKAMLPFVRRRRLVDFTMENVLRSGLKSAIVVGQYLPDPLHTYLGTAWAGRFSAGGMMLLFDGSGDAALPRYDGTADALHQLAARIDAEGAHEVLILSADHVSEMDYRPLIAAHRASSARITLAAKAVDHDQARGLRVVDMRADGAMTGFADRPNTPVTLPDQPDQALASIGVCVCDWDWLRQKLAEDSQSDSSSHDFDHDIVPLAVRDGEVQVYRWETEGERPAFWRSIDTLDAFRETALLFETGDAPCGLPSPELASAEPALSRFGMSTTVGGLRLFAPLRSRAGRADWGVVEDSVLMDGARMTPGCRLTRALIAPGVTLPEGLVVGEDPVEDRRWFRVTPGGTTLVTTQMVSRRAALMPRRSAGAIRGFFGQSV